MEKDKKKGILGQLLSVPYAVLKRAPVHHALFCTKPKNGDEWFVRIQHLAMYFALLLTLSMYSSPDEWRALFAYLRK